MSKDRDFVLYTSKEGMSEFDAAIKKEIDNFWEEYSFNQKKIKPRSKKFIGND